MELKDLAGGKSFPTFAAELFNACDLDTQIVKAKEMFGETGTIRATYKSRRPAKPSRTMLSPPFSRLRFVGGIDSRAIMIIMVGMVHMNVFGGMP